MGSAWKHVTNELLIPLSEIRSKLEEEHRGGSKLSNDQILDIKNRIKIGESDKLIASVYNLNKQSINLIRNKKTWKNIN